MRTLALRPADPRALEISTRKAFSPSMVRSNLDAAAVVERLISVHGMKMQLIHPVKTTGGEERTGTVR